MKNYARDIGLSVNPLSISTNGNGRSSVSDIMESVFCVFNCSSVDSRFLQPPLSKEAHLCLID